MSDILPPLGSEASPPALHPAFYGAEGWPGSVPTIPVCPLPLPGLPHEQLLPELSHELKTPLTGIMGLSQVLQRQTKSSVADRERHYASLIYQKSQQLLISINDLFDLAQLCTHQFVLQLRPISLTAVVETALKVVQQTTGAAMPPLEIATTSSEAADLWMMGDISRLEQLFTHLFGHFREQGRHEGAAVLKLRSQGQWLSITLTGPLGEAPGITPDHFHGSNPISEYFSATMPGHSGTVLKYLLAKQLAQLQGGDMGWLTRSSLETEVTVLLPRDLTYGTVLSRSGRSEPLFLVYSPQSSTVESVLQVLRSQEVLGVVGRSLRDIQEKVKILAPVALILDCCCLEDPEWPELRAGLTGQWIQNPVGLVWIGMSDPQEKHLLSPAGDLWPLPPTADHLAQTLQRLQQQSESLSYPPPGLGRSEGVRLKSDASEHSSRPFTVLQVDSVSPANPPESFAVELLAHLSKDYGCSVLVADDAEQAELLAQIWKPKAIVCTGSASYWVTHLSRSSLDQIPLVVLREEGRELPQSLSMPHGRVYAVDRTASLQQVVQRLFQTLIQTPQE